MKTEVIIQQEPKTCPTCHGTGTISTNITLRQGDLVGIHDYSWLPTELEKLLSNQMSLRSYIFMGAYDDIWMLQVPSSEVTEELRALLHRCVDDAWHYRTRYFFYHKGALCHKMPNQE